MPHAGKTKTVINELSAKPELNGRTGTALSFDDDEGRYKVELDETSSSFGRSSSLKEDFQKVIDN
jgi:hypothetical protein